MTCPCANPTCPATGTLSAILQRFLDVLRVAGEVELYTWEGP